MITLKVGSYPREKREQRERESRARRLVSIWMLAVEDQYNREIGAGPRGIYSF